VTSDTAKDKTVPAARRAETARQQGTAERITVALIPDAADNLQQLVTSTGLSKTDVVNRAISLYCFIEAHRRAGDDLLIRDGTTGETQLVKLL
jgi:hypothetical protein